MKTALAVIAVLAVQISSPSEVHSQATNRVQLVELHFRRDSAGTPTLELDKETVYWAELEGRGTPLLQSMRNGRQAFLVPVDSGGEPRHFHIYPLESGLHSVSLVDSGGGGGGGSIAILRLYRDVAETERFRSKRDREDGVAFGFTFAGGVHTGLSFDSLAGTDPAGGSNYEACLYLQASDRFATCAGGARQYFPDEDVLVGWLFLEERARLFSARTLGDHTTDFGVALRLSKSTGVDGRNTYPSMLGFGLLITHHLAAAGRRGGLSVVAAWQHGLLKGAENSQDRVTDQFVAGLLWIP